MSQDKTKTHFGHGRKELFDNNEPTYTAGTHRSRDENGNGNGATGRLMTSSSVHRVVIFAALCFLILNNCLLTSRHTLMSTWSVRHWDKRWWRHNFQKLKLQTLTSCQKRRHSNTFPITHQYADNNIKVIAQVSSAIQPNEWKRHSNDRFIIDICTLSPPI